MSRARNRGEQIRRFIIANVENHPGDIAKVAAEKFKISRQAVNKHLRRLVDEKALTRKGRTRNLTYHLHPLESWEKCYAIDSTLAEDKVWRDDIAPYLHALPDNVLGIWHYGFTEMLNNAIDHSAGAFVQIRYTRDARSTEIVILDDGIGIFRKIQTELELDDERHAVLELSKGKLTTDPEHHTGEGIFFTSRMFDDFDILSGDIFFSHTFGQHEDWILERSASSSGTAVFMRLNNHTSRTTKGIFNEFTSGEDFGFTKTVVPVRLAQYGDEKLISRSQAKRLLARIDRFKVVIFDFEGVDMIGQAFGDEVFRVFARKNPGIDIVPVNANPEVQKMIDRALSN